MIGDDGEVVFRKMREMYFTDLCGFIMESVALTGATEVFLFQNITTQKDMSEMITKTMNSNPIEMIVPIIVGDGSLNLHAVQKMHRLSSSVAALVAYIRNMGCGDDQVPGVVLTAENEISGMRGQLSGGLKWSCSPDGRIKWTMQRES